MKNIWKFVQYPTRLGECVILVFLALCALPVLAIDNVEVDKINEAIFELCKSAPNHPVIKRAGWRRELAGYIVEAADKYGEDPYLLTTILYFESSFRPEVIGKRGERGLGQIHGLAAQGCDLETPRGQTLCAARWLFLSRQQCDGTDEQALAKYATKGTCESKKGTKLRGMVIARMKIYQTLKD